MKIYPELIKYLDREEEADMKTLTTICLVGGGLILTFVVIALVTWIVIGGIMYDYYPYDDDYPGNT